MSTAPAKPVIFISYSHKDEPEHPREGEVLWLSFVRTYLQPAIKHGIFDLFVDEHLPGGANLKPEIECKLRACDVFVLLISANSTASDYIIDTEIQTTRDREANGEDIVFYPLLLTPTPKVALDKFKDKVVRPRDAKPLSSFRARALSRGRGCRPHDQSAPGRGPVTRRHRPAATRTMFRAAGGLRREWRRPFSRSRSRRASSEIRASAPRVWPRSRRFP